MAGHSIAAGSGESGPAVAYFVRAAGASSIALVNVVRLSELAVNFQGLGKRNRAAILATVSDVIYECATNDLSNGQTLAQMQAT